MQKNSVWILGNGKKVNFWLDNWTGEALAFKYKIPILLHAKITTKVADYWKDKAWPIHNNITLTMPSLLETINSFSISDLETEDSLAWRNVENGKLTITISYEMITKGSNSRKWKSFPWDIDSTPSHSMVVWRLMHNKIPTDENMTLRGFSFPSKFSLCDSNEENCTHLFFNFFSSQNMELVQQPLGCSKCY